MSIRYRLLLIVGLVTSLVFVFAFIINNRLLMSNLQKIREEGFFIQEKVAEKKREDVEKIISDSMATRLAQINALLETVSQFPSLSQWFAPSPENIQLGTWTHAAQFLQDEDWIQFIQNTSDSKLLSLIVPESGPFFKTESIPLEKEIAWIYILESTAYPHPCLGIKLSFNAKESLIEDDSSLVIANNLPTVYVLYTLDQLKSLIIPSSFLQKTEDDITEPSMQGYEVDEEKFYNTLIRAKELVSDPHFKEPEKKETSIVLDQEEPMKNTLSQKYLEQILEYSKELFLIGEVTSLRQSFFYNQGWPDALSFFEKENSQGKVFFLKPILGFSKPVFDDRTFFQKNPPAPGSFVSSGSAIIKSPHPNQAFFVNTVMLSLETGSQKKDSFLTIGFDINDLLYTFVSVSGHYGCMISGNEVVTELVPEGASSVPFQMIPSLLAEQSSLKGVFKLGDVEYYFVKIRPNETLDFYFCFFLPKEEEFKLAAIVQEKVKMILDHAWTQRIILELCSLLILWIFLLDLSKKITEPIVVLSRSLRYIKTGEWDLVKIPKIKFHKNNEVEQLVNSFQDMIEGMKEKEKMSAVLNKVVSKEIAQEILKGEVHLGGEEKEVTMLFADIRGFTKLTQNMGPHDIIHL